MDRIYNTSSESWLNPYLTFQSFFFIRESVNCKPNFEHHQKFQDHIVKEQREET